MGMSYIPVCSSSYFLLLFNISNEALLLNILITVRISQILGSTVHQSLERKHLSLLILKDAFLQYLVTFHIIDLCYLALLMKPIIIQSRSY